MATAALVRLPRMKVLGEIAVLELPGSDQSLGRHQETESLVAAQRDDHHHQQALEVADASAPVELDDVQPGLG
jgi:hypothetical protein